MEEYKIGVLVDESVFETLTEELEDATEANDLKAVEFFTEAIRFLHKIEHGTTVKTLEEYFNLLERVHEIWEDIDICNCGKFIEIAPWT